MYKIIVSVLSIGLLVACSTTKSTKSSVMSQTDVERGAKTFSGLTLDELNSGKLIYEENCGTCHGLKKPSSENADGWSHHVPEMVVLVNKKAGSEKIDAKKKDLILRYLITMSNAN